MNSHANDAMIQRLEQELEERNAAVQGIISGAQDGSRDLTATETETVNGLRERIGVIQGQLETLESTQKAAESVATRMKELDRALTTARKVGANEVEYRSAGAWALDSYKSAL